MSPNSPNLSVRSARLNDLTNLVEVLSDSFYPRNGLMRLFLPILRMGVYEDLRYRLRSSLASDYVCLVAVMTPPNGKPDLVGTVEITFRSTSFFFHSVAFLIRIFQIWLCIWKLEDKALRKSF